MSQLQPRTTNRQATIRRKAKGARVRCLAGAWGLGPDLGVALTDVSEKGARLLVKTPIAVGKEVELELSNVGSPKPLRLPGTVAWSAALADGQHCVGVRFQRYLSYADLQRLT